MDGDFADDKTKRPPENGFRRPFLLGVTPMTETRWSLANDPGDMLAFLLGKVNERKIRLFCCACCRRIWDVMTDPRSRCAVEMAEQYADETWNDRLSPALSAAHRAAEEAYEQSCDALENHEGPETESELLAQLATFAAAESSSQLPAALQLDPRFAGAHNIADTTASARAS